MALSSIQNNMLLYFQKQQAVLIEKYPLASEHLDSEAIHKIRLSIKKIKAFFNLILYLHPSCQIYKPRFKNLKVLFKSCGQVRDLQIQNYLLKAYEEKMDIQFTEFSGYFQSKQKKINKQFSKNQGIFQSEKLQNQEQKLVSLLMVLDDDYINRQASKKLRTNIKQIKKLSIKKKSAKNVHYIRKVLKESIYIMEINPWIKSTENEVVLFAALKNLSEELGLWHDREIMLQHLNIFSKIHHKKISEIEDYIILKGFLLLENKDFIKTLDKKLNEVVSLTKK